MKRDRLLKIYAARGPGGMEITRMGITLIKAILFGFLYSFRIRLNLFYTTCIGLQNHKYF